MNILLHTCCGPCTIYPYSLLKKEHDLSAFFFNPNIHPFKEFSRRKQTLIEFCSENNIPLVGNAEYGLKEYLRRVVGDEENKCNHCYAWRMEETAKTAREKGFDGFTTTLLYSRYQQHDKLKNFGYSLAEKYGIEFIYHDYREGWQEGIDKSIEQGMYRQPYCGCIFSEQERYDKTLRKAKR